MYVGQLHVVVSLLRISLRGIHERIVVLDGLPRKAGHMLNRGKFLENAEQLRFVSLSRGEVLQIEQELQAIVKQI